jgi:hypothetical protein
MSKLHSGLWLFVLLAMGAACAVASALLGIRINWLIPAGAAFIAIGGVAQLVVSILLGLRVLGPSRLFGVSALGGILQGVSWLSTGGLILLHEPLRVYSVPPVVAVIPAIVLVIGFRVEHAARTRHHVA